MGAARLYLAGTPYNAVDLQDLDYAQTADVVNFAHINYPPEKVVRADHTDWTFSEIDFGPTLAAPVGLSATPTINDTDNTLSNGSPNSNPQYWPKSKVYAVSAVNAEGQESRLSATDEATNDLGLRGNFNTLTWTAVAGAEYYNIYAQTNGSLEMGYIGRASTNAFLDNEGGVDPDYTDGPRIGYNPFDSAGNYPSTVAMHQQRSAWGRTRNNPNALWLSQSADFENMDRSRPIKPDDAFSVALVSERVNAISQLASMKQLLALTSDGIFSIAGAEGTALTFPPETERQIGIGSARLKPLVIDSTLFFRPAQGSSVATLGYTFEIDGLKSNNVAIFSPHLFNGFEILSWGFQREPFSIIWAARSDGKLLAFTWEQEQQVWGWTLCETSGFVEQVAVITENGMDRVYLAVRRDLAGSEDVFIERMAMPLLVGEDLVNSCYLDCALTQVTDDPTDTATGLWHLEGEEVMAFADGYVVEDLTVEGGSVTLPFEATTITVGLPYSGEIETLPLAMMGQQGTAHVDRQAIESVTVRVDKARGLKTGAGGGAELVELRQRTTEELDEPIALKTGDMTANIGMKWSNAATVRVVQDYPLPATISALFLKPKVTK